MSEVLKNLRTELAGLADEKTKASELRFFKEPVVSYGVKTDLVSKLAKAYLLKIKACSKKEVFALCDTLFKSNFNEEAWVACEWIYSRRKEFQPEDFEVFENWINLYINNWAKCDTLCNHSMAAFIDMYPQFLSGLKVWAKSENRWVKRASAVTLIIPAREGRYLKDIFEIANILLMDKDDMVQKGYGWMLKAASQAHSQEVFEYVMKHKAEMPRTALRYAIEKIPGEFKKRAMEKAS
jgi:3-methyladenine DNA glycosylase AlkD